MEKFTDFIKKFEYFILLVSFIIMILSTFAQVINRNFIGLGISWFEELARYCMIYMTLFATEMGLRDGSQISITILSDLTKGALNLILQVIIKLIIIVFSAIIFISSIDILKVQIISNQVSPGLRLHMYVPYFALTSSFGIIFMTQIFSLAVLILSKKKLFSHGG